MNTKKFEYTFLKSELTSEIILIIRLETEWLGKVLDFIIQKEEIEIIVEEQNFKSGLLPHMVSNWLHNNLTNVYFANEEGNIVSEAVVGGI